MTREEASIIIGNIPINDSDECYSVAEYQQAKTAAIIALQSPEIIYCKYCKAWKEEGFNHYCDQVCVIDDWRIIARYTKPDDYCSSARKRQDV